MFVSWFKVGSDNDKTPNKLLDSNDELRVWWIGLKLQNPQFVFSKTLK